MISIKIKIKICMQNHQQNQGARMRPDAARRKETRLQRLLEMRLRAREETIGYIPGRATHNTVKLTESNIIKYTYIHQDIIDDQFIKDNIFNRTIVLTAYRIQYVNNQAFERKQNSNPPDDHSFYTRTMKIMRWNTPTCIIADPNAHSAIIVTA